MKELIHDIELHTNSLKNMSETFDRVGIDHGSHEQTRAMVIESIFNQAIGNLNAAISQLKILDRELY